MKRINIFILSVFIFGIFSCQDNSNPLLTEDDPQNLDKLATYQEVSVVDEHLTPFVPVLPSGYASGMVAAGTGMEEQPGEINIIIPENVNIEKVFVYWDGRTESAGDTPDNTIDIGGYTDVEGTLIGQCEGNGFVYRADITDLSIDYELPIPVSGLSFNHRIDGAAIIVIYSNNETRSFIDIRDGADFAFICQPIPNEAVPQEFTFPSAETNRNAELWMIVGDAESAKRTDEIIVTVDGIPTSYKDELVGISGPELDVLKIDLEIPAGATEVKVELKSGPDGICGTETEPESLLWILGGLSIEMPAYSQCTYTQGYWKNHPEEWPITSLDLGNISYKKEQLLSILKTPVKGNGLVSLAHQLIAAKLNVENGADPSSISDTISDAGEIIGDLVMPPVGSGKLKPKETSSLVNILDSYNNGWIGPGHCD